MRSRVWARLASQVLVVEWRDDHLDIAEPEGAGQPGQPRLPGAVAPGKSRRVEKVLSRQPRADEPGRAGHRSAAGQSAGPSWRLPAEPAAKAELRARLPSKPVSKFPAKSVAKFELATKLMAKSTARWIGRTRFRPSCWPSWRPSTPCS